ncbi:usherin [Stigmatopora nigra]
METRNQVQSHVSSVVVFGSALGRLNTDLNTASPASAADGRPVFRQLWFMAAVAGGALLLMAAALGLALRKALRKAPWTRERPPLAATRRPAATAVYPASGSVLFDTAGAVSSVTLKSFSMKTEEALEAKGQGEERHGTSLRRGVSRSSSATEGMAGHDSGMFMDDEEFVDSVKGFSTVRKEHTMFTDTNL